MEDWIYSEEDVKALKQGDINARNKIYYSNYKRFKNIAIGLCRHRGTYDLVEDCLSQIYLGLPEYNFNFDLYFSVRYDIKQNVFGRRVYSLDAPINGKINCEDETTLGELIGVEDKYSFDNENSVENVVKIIDRQKYFSSRDRDMLISIALNVRPYKGIFDYEKRSLLLSKTKAV